MTVHAAHKAALGYGFFALSLALGIMKNFESRLVGYAFVAFVREFGSPNGERELHFHLAPDTKDVKTAVGDAMLLGELK